MLFILTGEIQTGKTRWLRRLVDRLSAAGVPVRGALAPGDWVRKEAGFEKRGIDNVLLPSGEVVHLARRRDLAEASGGLDALCQSERAGLGWAMSDDALSRVDAHFAGMVRGDRLDDGSAAASAPRRAGLTVVDELGRLELLRGEGLRHALELLERGPSARWPHAIAVVRRDLVPIACERLSAAWGDIRVIGPDDACAERVGRAVLKGRCVPSPSGGGPDYPAPEL